MVLGFGYRNNMGITWEREGILGYGHEYTKIYAANNGSDTLIELIELIKDILSKAMTSSDP